MAHLYVHREPLKPFQISPIHPSSHVPGGYNAFIVSDFI